MDPRHAKLRASVVALALAATTGTAILLTTSSSADRPSSSATPREPPSPADVFAVFRSPGPPIDPAERARIEQPSMPGEPAVDPALTRRVVSDSNVRAYALAGGARVCLRIDQAQREWGSKGCTTLRDPVAATKPLWMTTYIGNEHYQFSALVPDSIQAVHLETASGPEDLTFTNNAVSVELSSKPTTLTWTARDGTQGSALPWSDPG